MKRAQTFYIGRNPLEMHISQFKLPSYTQVKPRRTRLRLNVGHALLAAFVFNAVSLSMNNRVAQQLVSRAGPKLSGFREFPILLTHCCCLLPEEYCNPVRNIAVSAPGLQARSVQLFPILLIRALYW